MIGRILSNLERQYRAVKLLEQLQKEEFAHLSARDPGSVAAGEFSIQELLRQLARERHSLHQLYARLNPEAKHLADVMGQFTAEQAARAQELHKSIDVCEQHCAKLASRNYTMALGLYDVAKSSLDTLRGLLVPQRGVYGARGRMTKGTPGPGLISGRL